MELNRTAPRLTQRLLLPAIVALSAALLALLWLVSVSAQETPPSDTPAATTGTVTPEQTPPPGSPVVRLEVKADKLPVPKGDEFQAIVSVTNVTHMGAFDFAIKYDPKKVAPVLAAAAATPTDSTGAAAGTIHIKGDAGEFLGASPRGKSMVCEGPFTRETTKDVVYVTCFANAPPLCLGGPVGADGDGVLGRVSFKSKGGGTTELTLVPPTDLVSDDLQPCDFDTGNPVRIESTLSNASVDLAKTGGLSSAIIIVIVVVVVAVLAGGAGFLWYQRRGASTPPPASPPAAPPAT